MILTAIAAFCLFALAIQTGSIGLVLLRFRRASAEFLRESPPTTVLRPVCGLENNLLATLASGFQLKAPKIEQIFCAHAAGDSAIPIVRRLIVSHPNADARLLVGDDRVSINPKLNNLVKGWRAARHPWRVMADSNVLMPADYLEQLHACWREDTGLVCSPPVGTEPDGFFAEVECAWLNSFQARWQLVADEIGIGFAQGKTMLWRADILDDAGGIERLAGEVAEDAASTKIVRSAGLRVRLVTRPFAQPLGYRSASEVWRRQLRWARLRRASFPIAFAPEILAGGALPIAAAVVLASVGAWPVAAPIALAAIWYGLEWWLARAAGWPASPRQILAMIARDLTLPALYVAALFGNGFIWRGNQMAVGHRAAGAPRFTTAARRIRGLGAGFRRPARQRDALGRAAGVRAAWRRWF